LLPSPGAPALPAALFNTGKGGAGAGVPLKSASRTRRIATTGKETPCLPTPASRSGERGSPRGGAKKKQVMRKNQVLKGGPLTFPPL